MPQNEIEKKHVETVLFQGSNNLIIHLFSPNVEITRRPRTWPKRAGRDSGRVQ